MLAPTVLSPVLLLSANLLTAILQNDLVGWVCIGALVAISVFSVSLILQKFTYLKLAGSQTNAFHRLANSDGSWESLFVAAKSYKHSPLATLFRETYLECRLEKWFAANESSLTTEGRLTVARETIESVLNRVQAEEEGKLGGSLYWLAVMSSLAPFIGLLGTVWGILIAFQAIGSEGSAALGNLAPGISTALVTTIFGLLAAIPALIAHHHLTARVAKLCHQMESFSQELDNAVRKQIMKDRGAPR